MMWRTFLDIVLPHPQDLDAAPVRQLIELLLNTEELSVIRGLILGRCVGMCLSLPVTKSILLARATSDAGRRFISQPTLAIGALRLVWLFCQRRWLHVLGSCPRWG